ncbi:hypothetical protein EON67_12270, partial [archaeon]
MATEDAVAAGAPQSPPATSPRHAALLSRGSQTAPRHTSTRSRIQTMDTAALRALDSASVSPTKPCASLLRPGEPASAHAVDRFALSNSSSSSISGAAVAGGSGSGSGVGVGAAHSLHPAWLRATNSNSPLAGRTGSASLLRSHAPSPLIVSPAASPDPFTLVLTVMGAQHLPKRGGVEYGGVPSPFCSIMICGVRCACARAHVRAHSRTPHTLPLSRACACACACACSVGAVQDPVDTMKVRTRVVPDNGFNPVWSEQFRFTLQRPEVAILYIAVHDQMDLSRSALLAYFAVPIAA